MPLIIFKRPKGFTIEFGVNSKKCPQFYIGNQKYGKIRPRCREFIERYEDDVERAYYGGIKFDIGIGTIRRPIPKFWIKEFWIRDYAIKNPLTNPWNSGNHWFILNIPVMPYIFLGVFLGRWSKTNIIVKTLNKIFRTDDEDVREEYMPGFYIGGRTGYMREHGHQLAEFSPVDGSVVKWVTDEDGNPVYAWGDASENDNIYVEPTASIRTDFLH